MAKIHLAWIGEYWLILAFTTNQTIVFYIHIGKANNILDIRYLMFFQRKHESIIGVPFMKLRAACK